MRPLGRLPRLGDCCLMSHRDPSDQDDADRLADLERRLRERANAAETRKGPRHEGMGALGVAWRMSVEMVVAVGVGGALGLGLDTLFHTKPWIMVVGFMFGFAAGIRNAVRTAYRMQVPPTGQSVPDDEEDER